MLLFRNLGETRHQGVELEAICKPRYALWRLVPPLRRRIGGRAGLPADDSGCGGCSACGAAQRGCQDGAGLGKAGASGLPGEEAHAPLDTRRRR